MTMAATAVSGTAATIETAASTATAIGTSAAIATITAATAIPAAAGAERPLEARARAAAATDASRIARLKFFTRSAAATRSAGFAGEKNFVFCRAGCRDLRGLAFELAIVLFVMLTRVLVGIVFVMFVRFAVLGAVAVFGLVASGLSVFHRFDFFFVEFGDVLCFGLGLFTAGFGGLCAGSCEEPAGKGTTRAAWPRRRAGNDCATARLNVLRDVRLRLIDVFLDRSNGRGRYRPIAELCKRFTGKKNIVFRRSG